MAADARHVRTLPLVTIFLQASYRDSPRRMPKADSWNFWPTRTSWDLAFTS